MNIKASAKKFNKKAFIKDLYKVSGILDVSHIEWKDLNSINKWLKASRLSDERKFNFHPFNSTLS